MKVIALVSILFLYPVACYLQNSFTIHARPKEMSYCEMNSADLKPPGTCFAGKDMTGFILHIEYKTQGEIYIRLYKDGSVVEDIFSKEISGLRISSKKIYLTCSSFETLRTFHTQETTGAKQIRIDVSRKTRQGMLNFIYPDLNREYTYTFELL